MRVDHQREGHSRAVMRRFWFISQVLLLTLLFQSAHIIIEAASLPSAFKKHVDRKVEPRPKPTTVSAPLKPHPRAASPRPPLHPTSHRHDTIYSPSNYYRPPTATSDRGNVWSEWVDLPNHHIRRWHLLLRNVSYQDKVLYVHLHEGSHHSTSGLKSHLNYLNLQIVHTPLDLAKCTSYEKRRVTFSFLGHSKNQFTTNQGHLLINVIIPLFRYLFYVHNQLSNITDSSVIPDHQLPLRNTLLLLNTAVELTKSPTFLFDVVLRFAESYAGDKDYFSSVHSGDIRCFESIDVPLRDPVDPLHPGQPPKVIQYGVWDTMHFSHKGRWGRDNFYYNFWRNTKRQIWQLYDIPILSGFNGSTPAAPSNNTYFKPKLSFMVRSGNTYRCDGNIGAIREALANDFDVTLIDSGFYRWHANDEKMRYESTRRTLKTVQATDVMLGQTGSNNQLALFLQENKVLVEMKNYLYCNNEAAKALANHNRLSFYATTVSDVGIIRKNEPVHYDPARISKLSKEILSAWKSEVRSLDHETNVDSWPSTCDFIWPHQDPAIISKERIITRDNVSRCYLEQVPGKGWYQLGVHRNVVNRNCRDHNNPSNKIVLFCMVSDIC